MKELPKYINGMRIVSDYGYTKNKKRRIALFECPHCHSYFETRVDRAKEKRVNSCGCVTKKKIAASISKHGDCSIDSETHGIRSSWSNMKQRCANSNRNEYKYYGGRGITVCDEWDDYIVFKKWAVSNGWSNGLQIDRIDVDGNYEPSNCRWVTPMENSQQRNKRSSTRAKSGLLHVYWHNQNSYWYGRANIDGVTYTTGGFENKNEAFSEINLICEGRM